MPRHEDIPLFGLIGYPLEHSFSQSYFTRKFRESNIRAAYLNFPLPNLQDFSSLLHSSSRLRGLNVTTPHKEEIIPFLTSLSPAATAIQAVNCIDIKGDTRIGHNTDWIGFREGLLPLITGRSPRALVLGTGGASLAIRYALQQMGLSFSTVSTRPGKADFLYQDIDATQIAAHPLIINTTILGTMGHGCPELPYEFLGSDHILFDLVYNPARTLFLGQGLKQGARIENGLKMLEFQAEESWKIWNQD